MRNALRALLFIVVGFGFVVPIFAQRYPLPVSINSPAAICPSTVCVAYPNMPTAQFASPIKAFAGRFVDSTRVRDYQQPLRTLRARGTRYVPERKRLYMMIGSTVAVYNTDRLFGGYLGTPMSVGPALRYPDTSITEEYLPWDYSFYAENSTWQTPTVDGQTRLFGIDTDDRGNVYIATDTFGWGILTDTGSSLVSRSQMLNPEYPIPMKYIGVFKDGTKYYAVVGDPTGSILYDVTNVDAPAFVRKLNFGVFKFAKNDAMSVIAIATHDTAGYVYRANALATGGAPSAEINGTAVWAVTSSGSRFYFANWTSTPSVFNIVTVNSSDFTWTTTQISTEVSSFQPSDVRWGDGYLSLVGTINGSSAYVKLFRIESNGTFTEVPITSYFLKYYIQPDSGYAKPPGYTGIIADTQVIKYNSKTYFFYSGHGMGDVYEMDGGDTVENHIDNGVPWGTQNSRNPNKALGPYYGDLVSFGSSGTGQSTNALIHWDFANPESGSSNTQDANAGTGVSHRYAGLTSSASITATKKVTITGVYNSALAAFTNLTLKAPAGRVVMPFSGGSYTFPGTVSPAIVTGDQFFDASDGTVEGHYASWNLDGTVSTGTPLEALGAGQCGSHSLSFSANYIPYTGTGNSIVPAAGIFNYPVSVEPIGYDVKPFTAKIAIQGSTAGDVTFANAGRVGAASTFANATSAPLVTFTWDLLDSNGAVIAGHTQTSAAPEPITNAAPYTMPKTGIGASKVRLTITMDGAQLADASCSTYLTATNEFRLVSPDPTVDVTNCSSGRPYANGPCTLTAKSSSSQDQTGWTYQWYLDSGAVAGATGATYSPAFTAAGAHNVWVSASTAIGSGTSGTTLIDVQAQTCTWAVPQGILTVTPSCSDCGATKTVSFSVYAWGGYVFQPCDTFSWNFGDNQTATGKNASHTYAGDGNYTVTVSVSNMNNSTPSTGSATVKIGTVVVPTCPTVAPQNGQIFAEYTGSAGCSPSKACGTGETVNFTATGWGYTFQSCDSYSWDFGDGGHASGKSASHTYANSGSYTATVTVSNSKGSAVGTSAVNVTTGGGGNCSAPKSGTIFPEFTGATSGCTSTNGKDCKPAETISFTGQTFGYNYQTCDTLIWSWGDNTASTSGPSTTTRIATHTYANPGTYNVTLTVQNSSGSVSAPVTVKVASGIPLPNPPSVTIQPSATNIAIGSSVTFIGTATPADGITAWNWTLTNSSGAAVSTWTNQGTVVYKFVTAGAYDMKLTASNLGGTSAPAIVRITVSANTFTYLLPVVAHIPGQNGSAWRTDLQIYSPSYDSANPSELTFEFKGAKTKLKPNSSTKIYEDFLQTLTGADDGGPVIVTGTDAIPPQMWTRTYTVSPSGIGTFGQLIPAIPLDSAQQSVDAARSYIVSGVELSSRYRTNLGIVNPNNAAVTVHVEAFDDSQYGIALGEFDTTVQPLQLLQITDLSLRIPATQNGKAFTLKVTPTTAVQIIAYGSMVDQVSNDPVYIPAIADVSQSSADFKNQVLPGVGHLQQDSGTWRSDVTVFNPDSAGVIFDLTYYDSTGTKLSEAKTIPLAGNAFLRLQDVLRSPILPSPPADSFGLIRIDTVGSTPNRYPVVVARTYKDRDTDGTFGQGIPAVAPARANVTLTKAAVIPGIRSDAAYYTNLGLVALGTEPTRVRVTLLDKTTGQGIGTWERAYVDGKPNPLFANESIIATDIIRGISPTADAGTLKIEVLEGGPVWAYASVVDKKTFDPEYVPATPLN